MMLPRHSLRPLGSRRPNRDAVPAKPGAAQGTRRLLRYAEYCVMLRSEDLRGHTYCRGSERGVFHSYPSCWLVQDRSSSDLR